MTRRRLPIGIQTFREIRERDCYYVDKTAYIRRLLDEGNHYFLSAPAALRQEPVPRHLQAAFRGKRGTVRGACHPRPLGLVSAPSRGAPELRKRPLPGTGRSANGSDGPVGGGRARSGGHRTPRQRLGPPRPRDQDAARAHRAASGGARRRVRQADSGRAGHTGDRSRQPGLPARPVRGHQGQRRPYPLQLHHRSEQVLQGQSVLRG